MPSRPCSAPVVHPAREVEHDGAPAVVEAHHAPGLLEHPQARSGSPGATPTNVGRLRPVGDPLDVERCARPLSVAGGTGSMPLSESPPAPSATAAATASAAVAATAVRQAARAC